jgi:hypothetical protein
MNKRSLLSHSENWNYQSLKMSAYCGRGEDRTQYFLACSPMLLPTQLSCRPWTV